MNELGFAYLLASAAAIIAIACAIVLWRLTSHFARFEQNYRRQIQVLQSQVANANTSAVGVGQRVLELETKLKKLSETQEQIGEQSENYAYTQAMHMLDQGADVATVVSSCGLSSSEAQLMALMRQHLRPSSGKSAGVAAKTKSRQGP